MLNTPNTLNISNIFDIFFIILLTINTSKYRYSIYSIYYYNKYYKTTQIFECKETVTIQPRDWKYKKDAGKWPPPLKEGMKVSFEVRITKKTKASNVFFFFFSTTKI